MAIDTEITMEDLTQESKATGTGVFDVLMRAVKEHVVDEYTQGRIQGTEYSTVYLGALQGTLNSSLEFLLKKDETALRLQILEVELEKIQIEKEKAEAERDLIQAQILKVNAEISLLAQQELQTIAETARVEAQTALIDQQTTNATKEYEVLDATVCKLQAEFDLLVAQVPKVEAETGLLAQKKVTETAQTNGSGVADVSVIGRQMTLYKNQAEGFIRDAEQKAAKIMADTWNVRRTTDEGTSANTTNKLDDSSVGRAMTKLLDGVNA